MDYSLYVDKETGEMLRERMQKKINYWTPSPRYAHMSTRSVCEAIHSKEQWTY